MVVDTSLWPSTFTVEPKKAIYLGNYHFKVTDTFMRIPLKAVVTLSDQGARDLPAIKAAFPALSDVPIGTTISENLVVEGLGGGSRGRTDIPIFIPVVHR